MPSGPAEGAVMAPEDLIMEIEDYYAARGWTAEGLIPSSKLVELGLTDIAEEIGVEEAAAQAVVEEA